MLYIIKCPHFIKTHLNQLRKRITDKTYAWFPEETVIDVISDTFDIPTHLAAPKMRRSYRKKKTTDLIVVNQNRVKY